MGGKVISLSDSEGTLYAEAGLSDEQWEYLMELKNVRRGRIREMAEQFSLQFLEGRRPWGLACDIALPCATQNELDAEDARRLLANGCVCVAEGANMPSTLEAVDLFLEAGILYAPGKASNAGGVAVSGLEMSQNAMRLRWSEGEVDTKLHGIMQSIHHACLLYGEEQGRVNYVKGRTSPASSRSPMRCWRRAWSEVVHRKNGLQGSPFFLVAVIPRDAAWSPCWPAAADIRRAAACRSGCAGRRRCSPRRPAPTACRAGRCP